jgi:hypothetical protein
MTFIELNKNINGILSIDNSNKVLLPLLAKCHKEIVTNLGQV